LIVCRPVFPASSQDFGVRFARASITADGQAFRTKVARLLFAEILRLIGELRPRPVPP
jgi:hypothetical protein